MERKLSARVGINPKDKKTIPKTFTSTVRDPHRRDRLGTAPWLLLDNCPNGDQGLPRTSGSLAIAVHAHSIEGAEVESRPANVCPAATVRVAQATAHASRCVSMCREKPNRQSGAEIQLAARPDLSCEEIRPAHHLIWRAY